MRRIVLVVGLLLVATLSVTACGSSSESDDSPESSGDPRVIASVEDTLGRRIEGQLRRELQDRALRVRDFRCAGAGGDNVQCLIRATDSSGARGSISLAVVIDPRRGTAMAQFTGTSRNRWAALMRRSAEAQREQAASR